MSKAKMEQKTFKLEVKELSANGTLDGYLSTFGNVDEGGDVVETGAFTKTLKENKAFPLIWSHDPSEPAKIVGSFHGREDKRGLFINADFLADADSQSVRVKVQNLIERGVKFGLSIGYKVINWTLDKTGEQFIRHLKELKLYEGSLALFPMNEEALVMSVKSLDLKPYPNEHSCRLRDPGDFEEGSIRSMTREHEGKKYRVLLGNLKGEEELTEQAYRYPKKTWDADAAEAHCKDHGGSFEAAAGKCATCGALIEDEPGEPTHQDEPLPDDKNKPTEGHLLEGYVSALRLAHEKLFIRREQ